MRFPMRYLFSLFFLSRGFVHYCENNVRFDYIPPLLDVEKIPYHQLTYQSFLDNIYLQRPVVVTGSSGPWNSPHLWHPDKLKEKYGSETIQVGTSSSIVSNNGEGNIYCHLSDYFEGNCLVNLNDQQIIPSYVFDRNNFFQTFNHQLIQDFPFCSPSWHPTKEKDWDLFFLVGGQGSGVAFHRHTDGWNSLAFGEKHWYIYPPSRRPFGEFPSYHGHNEWLDKIYPFLSEMDKPIEVIQKAGDLIYIPEGWYHATTVEKSMYTAGMACQTAHASTEFWKSYMAAGKLEKIKENADKAIKLLTYALDFDRPSSFVTYFQIGLWLQIKGEHQLAFESFAKGIENNDMSAELYAAAGISLRWLGNHSDAMTMFSNAIYLNPYDSRPYYSLGKALQQFGQKEMALNFYGACLEIDPEEKRCKEGFEEVKE
eukprot:Lithocolla_globosa_v1_NODE_3917_length_1551_cov_4.167781.p1 type:complete len:426 gc:universal NODE_3917_length_1551_cov_4.167781:1444-167(-)